MVDEATAAVEIAPPELRQAVAAALEIVGALPSRRLHGDFQRKNILLAGDGEIGVIDWERAYHDGPPGLDLLFLALMAKSDRPDREVARSLADGGGGAAWAPLQRYLLESGLEGIDLRRYVLAALAVWAADEGQRLCALGLPRPGRARYLELLLDLGPSLA